MSMTFTTATRNQLLLTVQQAMTAVVHLKSSPCMKDTGYLTIRRRCISW